jgi:phosphopantothenoylcysteine decarboxylase / phosphopantothenate---cysteine ligase
MTSTLHGQKIILGVSGSIAAYKSVLLLRLLQQAGAVVQPVLTQGATKFVQPLTFSTLAQRPAVVDLWDTAADWSQHVHLGKWADAMLIAPATANTLAKCAHGLCEDALSAVYLSADCPVFFAPAMDLDMYRHPSTQANLKQLEAYRHHLIEAHSGYLASGLEGQGRMAEPVTIVQVLEHYFAEQKAQHSPNNTHTELHGLRGLRVLITAGPTQEPLDPVRYLTNHSSGKMGLALAEAAANAGALVTLVLGPVNATPPVGVEVVHVTTAQDMFDATTNRQAGRDVVIMCAAVADFTPAVVSTEKIKKQPGQDELLLRLVRTPDILAHLGHHKSTGQVLVGFALETTDALAHAQRKLETKRLDLCVLNIAQQQGGTVFGANTNLVTLLQPNREPFAYPNLPKPDVAALILSRVLEIRGSSTP